MWVYFRNVSFLIIWNPRKSLNSGIKDPEKWSQTPSFKYVFGPMSRKSTSAVHSHTRCHFRAFEPYTRYHLYFGNAIPFRKNQFVEVNQDFLLVVMSGENACKVWPPKLRGKHQHRSLCGKTGECTAIFILVKQKLFKIDRER